MNIIICENYEKMSDTAATIIAAQVMTKPDSVLGLATGGAPVGTYERLVTLNIEGALDFSKVKTINLDEYIGIEKTNSQSYYHFMMENLFSKININRANISLPNGLAADLAKECESYEELIEAVGGIDLQLLGIGHNGHIRFNEPGDYFSRLTHVVELTESTVNANARYFSSKSEVPRSAITMGVGAIMKAGKILMLASGEQKADIISELVHGEITPRIPASILKLHSDVTIIVDRLAGAGIDDL